MKRWILPVMLLFCRTVCASTNDEYNQGPVFAIIEENDLLVKTDRHYTQGIKLSYLGADNHLPLCISNLSQWLPQFGFTNRALKFGIEIGQSIYTPRDVANTRYLPEDRPYAGWLYTGFILQRRGTTSRDNPVFENIQLDLGIIGPWSLAKEAQTWVHQLRGFALPKGWGNQVKNEPGIDFKYERIWRLQWPHEGSHYFDIMPRGGFNLGNVETSARIGGMMRFGFNIPHDFGPPTIDSIHTAEGGWEKSTDAGRWGVYGFLGTQAREVLHTAFLDGNLLQSGAHIEKYTFVGQWYGGFVFVLRRVDIGFTYVVRTREYVNQPDLDAFGSVFLKWRL